MYTWEACLNFFFPSACLSESPFASLKPMDESSLPPSLLLALSPFLPPLLTCNEIVGVGVLGCLFDFGIGGAGSPVTDVLGDGTSEKCLEGGEEEGTTGDRESTRDKKRVRGWPHTCRGKIGKILYANVLPSSLSPSLPRTGSCSTSPTCPLTHAGSTAPTSSPSTHILPPPSPPPLSR